MTPPDAVLSRGLDRVASNYFKHTGPIDERAMRRSLAMESILVAEALLLAPRITFSIYGENVVAALLADRFGVAPVTKLVREGAIQFLLNDQAVFSLDEPIEGVDPLAHGRMNDPAHSEPEASAKMGLEGWGGSIPRDARRELARRVTKRTSVMPENIAAATARRALDLARSGALAEVGISAEDAAGTDPAKHRALREFATDLMQAALLTSRRLDLLNDAEVWHTLTLAANTVRTPDGLHQVTTDILEYEALPDIPSMLLKGQLSFADIPNLRARPEVAEFRRWLWSGTRADDFRKARDEYRDLLASLTKQPPASLATKAVRVTSFSVLGTAVSAGVGALAAGPVGAIVLGGVACLGISLFDGMVFDRLTTNPNPRRLSTDILRPRVATGTAR